MGPTKQSRSRSDRLQCYLSEYEKLRSEILERLKIQKEVERSQVLLIGVFVAAASLIWDKQVYFVLLAASALFFVIGTSFFEQDINIALLATYLHKELRKLIHAEFKSEKEINDGNEGVFAWERFRHDEFLKTATSTVLTINRTLLTYLPGFATLGAYLYIKYGTALVPRAWSEIELVLLFVNIILAVFLVLMGNTVPKLYKHIAPR